MVDQLKAEPRPSLQLREVAQRLPTKLLGRQSREIGALVRAEE